MNTFLVELFWSEDLTADGITYDALVGAVGFEQRSSFVPLQLHALTANRYATEFSQRKDLAHDQNRAKLTDAGFQIREQNAAEFCEWFGELLEFLGNHGKDEIKLAVDISSLTRLRIAHIVASLAFGKIWTPISVDFFYAPARFSKPAATPAPIMHSGPVTEDFAGWSSEPDKPLASVFDLGYDQEKAVGALELLEPAAIWAFMPTGEDLRYDKEVRRANEFFWEQVPEKNLLDYRVDRPDQIFYQLESLIYGLKPEYRPLIVPLGPKIFALCALLVGAFHYPDLTVWRVTSGTLAGGVDRVASGRIYGLRVLFKPSV